MKKAGSLLALFICMVAIAIYTSSTAIEIVATMTGLLCVGLTAKEHIWAWPIGLVNVGCFFVMFGERQTICRYDAAGDLFRFKCVWLDHVADE